MAIAVGVMLLSVMHAVPALPVELTTAMPQEIDAPLVNPDQGWGLWVGPRYYTGRPVSLAENTAGFGDDAPLFSWVLIDWMWADLQPAPDRFDWQELDAVMQYWAARGKQIDLRVWVTDDTGWDGAPGNVVVPDWVWRSGAPYHEYTGEGQTRKREPDYAAPAYRTKYLPLLRSFLQTLAARYDADGSPVTYWGVMGYGNWGEWHTLHSHYPWPNREVKHQVLDGLVQLYDETFRKPKIISIAYDTDYMAGEVQSLDDFEYRQGHDLSTRKGFYLARHAFVDKLALFDAEMMRQFWRSEPIWAEGNWNYLDVTQEHSHGSFDENLDVMTEWHANWGHFYTDAGSYRLEMQNDRATLERGLKAGGFGCRLVPRKLSWPASLPAGHLLLIRSEWVNRNSGRCIVGYPLSIALTDASGNVKFVAPDRSFDETHWVKGETYPVTSIVALPKALAPGTYEVRIALTDRAGTPMVRLGIAGADPNLRYAVGSIHIESSDVP